MFVGTERLCMPAIFPEGWRTVFSGMSDGHVPRMLAPRAVSLHS